MQFKSLNTSTLQRGFMEAMIEGLAPDRGLYFPMAFPQLSQEIWKSSSLSLEELGAQILAPFCAPYLTQLQLEKLLSEVLSFPIPLLKLDENRYVLELFHGPTAAFKDVGARFLARALSELISRESRDSLPQHLTVLVATSGDTGSAVAQGFAQVPHIDVVILYPSGRISHVQEQQLTTVGGNVTALEVKGSFDDCQNLVKSAFLDEELRSIRPLTSANSINVARWLPQVIYYAWATYQLKIPLCFSVPSGNLGNLAAGSLATQLGMPIDGLIAATNANNGLIRHLAGESFVARQSIPTLSNAMDVGNPSNLPRLQALYDGNLERMRSEIWGCTVSDTETLETIDQVFHQYQYLMCPHTAVGWRASNHYQNTQRVDRIKQNHVVLATAHPAKFTETVFKATGQTPLLPPLLQSCLKRKKQSVLIEATDMALKQYLLETQKN